MTDPTFDNENLAGTDVDTHLDVPLGGEPAVVIGIVVAIATALLGVPELLDLSDTLRVILTVLVTVGGAFGIRARVSPISR